MVEHSIAKLSNVVEGATQKGRAHLERKVWKYEGCQPWPKAHRTAGLCVKRRVK